MKESPTNRPRPTGLINLSIWLAMIAAAAWGALLCAGVFNMSLMSLKKPNVEFAIKIPTKFRIEAGSENEGFIDGQSSGTFEGSIRGNIDSGFGNPISGRINVEGASTLKGKTQSSGRIYGYMHDNSFEHVFVTFPKPNLPWLRLAFILMAFSILAYLRKLYLILRRKAAAIESTRWLAATMAAGGLMWSAGEDRSDIAFIHGILIVLHAGLGYFLYNNWTRVRDQLYKD